ncbi:GTPase-associated protein 1-related protein, partial [Streptomyces sp. NPDC059456]|uniref:GTPase-associated protein 1-related protein n=1 Tax=Streptomyces sp. NPDC059456 TaxID=3346838 RepID=UPI0036BBF687
GAPRVAGPGEVLARGAVSAPAGDRSAQELAPELLRRFPTELPAALRSSLLLLELARNLRVRQTEPGWVRRALELGAAGPTPTAREHAYAAAAARLLAEDRPGSEVRALIESNDAELLAAYRRAAREPRIADRLRLDPAYAAECFATWSSQPQAGALWQETRTDLLDGVLRPVVRGLAPAELAVLEEALARLGGRWAEDFRGWQRPGAFGRLRGRFGGSGRRGARGTSGTPPLRGGSGGPIAPGGDPAGRAEDGRHP